jgi:hypothetical protein
VDTFTLDTTTYTPDTTVEALASTTAQSSSPTTTHKSSTSKGSLAGIIGTVFVGTIILIAVAMYLYREKRRKRLLREAIAYDPTSVDRICEEEKQREQYGNRNIWYDDATLARDFSRYPSLMLDQHDVPTLPSTPSVLNSLNPLSLPRSALGRSSLGFDDDMSFDSIHKRYISD